MNTDTTNTIITGVFGLIALFLGGGATVGFVRSNRKPKTEIQQEAAQVDELLAKLDGGNLTDLVRTLITENGKQRERLEKIEGTVRQLEEDIDAMRSIDTHFREALGRWLASIFAAWGRVGAMPMPAGEDLITLREVIPH